MIYGIWFVLKCPKILLILSKIAYRRLYGNPILLKVKLPSSSLRVLRVKLAFTTFAGTKLFILHSAFCVLRSVFCVLHSVTSVSKEKARL
jgi:hypothetical protein